MDGLRIIALAPVLIFFAVNEFTVMMILPVMGIQEGPVKYLIDSAFLVALSTPFLYLWSRRVQTSGSGHHGQTSRDPQHQTLEALEREALIAALRRTHGDRTRAAHMLGISRATIYRMIKRFGLRQAPHTETGLSGSRRGNAESLCLRQ